MVLRKGLAKGRGKGYKNVLPSDKRIHSQSARGIKQRQKVKTFFLDFKTGNKKPKKKLVMKAEHIELYSLEESDRMIDRLTDYEIYTNAGLTKQWNENEADYHEVRIGLESYDERTDELLDMGRKKLSDRFKTKIKILLKKDPITYFKENAPSIDKNTLLEKGWAEYRY